MKGDGYLSQHASIAANEFIHGRGLGKRILKTGKELPTLSTSVNPPNLSVFSAILDGMESPLVIEFEVFI